MKAIVLDQFGIDQLRVIDIPRPEPRDHEVLVRIKASAIQYLDGQIVEGKMLPDLSLPHIPGCEGAGVVESVGECITRWKVGDRVLIPFIQRWEAGSTSTYHNGLRTGVNLPGTLREYGVFPENTLVRSPQNLSDQEAATLPCIGLTAWTQLVSQAKIKAGQTILIQGTGSVSLFALQIAKASGMKIIATSGDNKKAEKLLKLGAVKTINYKSDKNWSAAVKQANDGQGVDVTLDIGGADTIQQSILSCKENGYVGLVGFTSGSSMYINVHTLIMNYIRLQGFSVGSAEELAELVAAVEINEIKPVIDQVFGLDHTQEAFKRLQSGDAIGRIIIEV